MNLPTIEQVERAREKVKWERRHWEMDIRCGSEKQAKEWGEVQDYLQALKRIVRGRKYIVKNMGGTLHIWGHPYRNLREGTEIFIILPPEEKEGKSDNR